jgi:DNA-binding response OmpR family regulator
MRPTDVAVLQYPGEHERLAGLRDSGVPRLLLVEAGAPPPANVDPLEDWVRVPAPDEDVRARLATLAARADHVVPNVDADGLLHYDGRWVALSPVEQALAHALTERFGAVVSRDTLGRRAWPGGAPTRNALDVHVLRLRRRIAAVSLEVRTVRSRGYLLQSTAAGST